MKITVTHHTYSSPFDGRQMHHKGDCTLLNCEVAQYLFTTDAQPDCAVRHTTIDNRHAVPLD